MGVVIDRTRVECQQLFEAASVERQFLDLRLVDQAGGRTHRRIDERRFFRYLYFFSDGSNFQCQIHHSLLTDHKIDPAPHLLLEAGQVCDEFVRAYRKRLEIVAAGLIADDRAHQSALGIRDGNTDSRQNRSRSIPYRA